MKRSPIYEQVSAGTPGTAFKPSGLYRLVGHAVDGAFIKVDRPHPLRTLAEWQAMPSDMPWKCPNCLRTLPAVTEGTRGAPPCPHCDGTPAPAGTAAVPQTAQAAPQPYTVPPDTLGRLVAMHRQGRITEEKPVAGEVGLLAPPPPRQTYAPLHSSTLDEVLRVQRQLNQRPPAAQPLIVMAQEPCERCGATQGCPCPPRVRSVLTAAVAHRKQEHERHMVSQRSAYPMLGR